MVQFSGLYPRFDPQHPKLLLVCCLQLHSNRQALLGTCPCPGLSVPVRATAVEHPSPDHKSSRGEGWSSPSKEGHPESSLVGTRDVST